MTSDAQTFWGLLALVAVAAAIFVLVLGRQLVQRRRGEVTREAIDSDTVDPEQPDD